MTAASADKAIRKQRMNEYPIQIWYFLACFIFLVAAFQLVSRVYSHVVWKKKNVLPKGEDFQIRSRRSSPSLLRLSYISLGFLNAYRVTMFRTSFHIDMLGSPYTLNLAEVFVTLAYIVAIFTWAFINTTDLEGVKLDYQYWGNRAGAIAASQLPLVTALGTKNNVVGLITGISYDKLNSVHRMTSRVIFVLVWVHGANKLALNGVDSGDWPTVWLRAGIMAAVSFALLVVVSLRPVRAKSYGLFFWVHFTMVLITLVGSYYHTKNFNLQKYIWPCFVVWGLDRLIRVMRIVFFSLSPILFSSKKYTGEVKCDVISDDTLRLTVPQPPHFHWSPGQHVNIAMPGAFRYLWHPFTIATLDRGYNRVTVSDKEKGVSESEGKSAGMQFFINVRSGSTRRLAEYVRRDNLSKMKIFVDGPYGLPPRLEGFDNCVLLAGGTGVAFTLPLFLDVIEKVQDQKSACRRVVFIWATRDIKTLKLVSDTVSSAVHRAPSSLSVDVRFHVTGTSDTLDSRDSGSDDGSSVKDIGSDASPSPTELGSPHIHLHSGRPDLGKILAEEIEVTRGDKLSVNVCGSDSMTRSARSALRMGVAGPVSIMKGGASVSLFVEGFGYA